MKFSIIITVTNPKKSFYALESALNQDFDDYEIIFSNNSGIDLKNKLKQIKTNKIRYFKTSKYLRIVEHWNFAFSKAKGDWQILLCDDDALVFNILEKLNNIINENLDCEIFMWNYGFYKKNKDKTIFSFQKNNDKPTSVLSSTNILKLLYDNAVLNSNVKLICPFFPRVTFSKNLILRIKKKLGTLFLTPDPMTSSAVAGLKLTNKITKINDTYTIIDINEGKNAGSHISNSKTFERMHKNVNIQYSPIKNMHNFPSTNLDSLIKVEKKINNFDLKKINLKKFYFYSYLQIEELNKNQNLKIKVLKSFNKDFKKENAILKISFLISVLIYKLFKLKLFNYIKNKIYPSVSFRLFKFKKNSDINSFCKNSK